MEEAKQTILEAFKTATPDMYHSLAQAYATLVGTEYTTMQVERDRRTWDGLSATSNTMTDSTTGQPTQEH